MNTNPAIKYLPTRDTHNEVKLILHQLDELRRKVDPDDEEALALCEACEELELYEAVLWGRIEEGEAEAGGRQP